MRALALALAAGLVGCADEQPRLNVTIAGTGEAHGYLLGAWLGEDPKLFLADREGRIFWDVRGEGGILSPVISQPRDGTGLLYNAFAEDRSLDLGAVYRVGLDGTRLDSVRTEEAHHTFVDLPDGSIAYLAMDIRQHELHGSVVGDRVVEIHPDGRVSQVFSVWEHLDVIPHGDWASTFYPQGHDWTHANALHYDELADSYLISFRNVSQVLEVDRSTGEILRAFGGPLSDYAVDPPEAAFTYQHGAHWTREGTLLLTSSGSPVGGGLGDQETWASEFEVDEEAGTLREVFTYGRGDGLHARALGEAHRLPNGNTLVNWGTEGLLREVTPGGGVVWEMRAGGEAFFGRVSYLDDIGPLLDEAAVNDAGIVR